MAAKDIKIFLKTIADVTGLARLKSYLKEHVTGLGAVKTAYAGLKKAGSAALDALGAAWRGTQRAAAAIGVSMGASVREFYAWNSEASRAWALMGIGREEFVKMRREISAMSAELGVSKAALGKGWKLAAGSGIEDNQIIPFLRTAAQVAVTDGSDIETAINGITTVLNAFGYASADAARVTDMLFANTDRGKSSFQALASFIAQAAPTAAALGVGLDQILAAEVHLSKQGYATSTSYVAIRNAMLALSEQLGDGWAKTMSFQEALVKVVDAAEGSETALAKIFGDRTVGAVLAMTGAQAAKAAEELDRMRSTTGSLPAAFSKVDSEIGHWPKFWQSLRLLVTDIGEAIDTALKPAINYISEQLRKLRDSGGFEAFVDRLGERVRGIVEAAIAGVKTVVDLVSQASVGSLVGGAVNALVDMAVTLLAEGLRSLGTVMVALARIFSAALAADFMKVDIWGRNELKSAQKAAAKKIPDLSADEAQQFGLDMNYFGQLQSTGNTQLRAILVEDLAKKLDLEQATAVATYSKDADVNAAIGKAFESFAASRARIGGAGERIVGNLGRRTGLDIGEMYARNLDETRAGFSGQTAAEPMRARIDDARARASSMGASLAAGANDGRGDDESERRLLEENRQLREKLQSVTEAETETFAAIAQALQAMERKYRDLKTAVTQIPNA